MKLAFALLCSVLVLSACSKPTDAVIPSDMATWDKELAPHMKKLSPEDREAATAYLMRSKLGEAFGGKGGPVGMTLGQAVEEQKKFAAEQAAKQAAEDALKAKLQAERTAALEQLNKTVTVTLLSKRQLPRNWEQRRISDYQEVSIGVQNNSDKPIAGVSGTVELIDIFDKRLGGIGFRISEDIEPGKSVTWVGGRDYNQFLDEHKAIWNAEDGKYKTRFIADTVVFKDGTKLTVPK